MAIIPDSQIVFMGSVPLDPDYRNTIYWTNSADQQNYFQSKAVMSNLTDFNTVRVSDKEIYVDKPLGDMYYVNYMAFQNTSISTKIFYAFVTNVEYVSDNCTRVEYKVDVMQTFFFDYTLGRVYVDREHAMRDKPGDNLLPEPVDVGTLVCTAASDRVTGSFKPDCPSDLVICCAHTYTPSDNSPAPGSIIGGVYQGCNIDVYELSQMGTLNAFLDIATNRDGGYGIVSVFMCPRFATTAGGTATGYYSECQVTRLETVSGYRPRNKKLLTYPFNALKIECSGRSQIYRYEYFISEDGVAKFQGYGALSPDTSIILLPKGRYDARPYECDYKGGSFDCALTSHGFPQCSYSTDSYKAWLALNGAQAVIDGVSSFAGGLLSTAGSLAMGNGFGAAGGLTSLISGTASSINQAVQASQLSAGMHGQLSASTAALSGGLNFHFYDLSVNREYAAVIDDYFDRFGYACNRLKVPNRNGRPEWNYVKTVECSLSPQEGSRFQIPGLYEQEIVSIYNRGITFWNHAEHVGNYSLNNQI